MSLSSDGTVMTMPVTPAYGGGYGNGMWGGDWGAWILLFLLFGFGRGGWGGFGNESSCCAPATCADLQRGFDNQSVMNKLNGIEQGISQAGYAALQQTNTLENGLCQLGYQTQVAVNGLGTQLQQCCFDNARAIDGVNYNMATQANGIQTAIQGVRYDMATQACDTRNTIQNTTRDIIDNANANSRAILDFLTQDKIATLTAENQSLKFQASQTAQNAFITANQEAQTAELIRRLGRDCPIPAYVVPNPNCCYNPCGTCA